LHQVLIDYQRLTTLSSTSSTILLFVVMLSRFAENDFNFD